MRRIFLLSSVLLLAVAPAALGQAKRGPHPTPTPTPEPEAAKPAESESTPAYTYEVGGRRDPFRSLLVRNAIDRDRVRPPGLSGVMVDEIELQGTVRTKGGWLAIIRAADNRSYLIRKGQALFDGEVIEITADDVTFRQNVNDPTNPKPFREVTKSLGLQRKR
jgi:Tfp pilus assembly protein PilP